MLVSWFLIITYHRIPEKSIQIVSDYEYWINLTLFHFCLPIIKLNLLRGQYFDTIFSVHLNPIFVWNILMLHVNLHIPHQLSLDEIKLQVHENELDQSKKLCKSISKLCTIKVHLYKFSFVTFFAIDNYLNICIYLLYIYVIDIKKKIIILVNTHVNFVTIR